MPFPFQCEDNLFKTESENHTLSGRTSPSVRPSYPPGDLGIGMTKPASLVPVQISADDQQGVAPGRVTGTVT